MFWSVPEDLCRSYANTTHFQRRNLSIRIWVSKGVLEPSSHWFRGTIVLAEQVPIWSLLSLRETPEDVTNSSNAKFKAPEPQKVPPKNSVRGTGQFLLTVATMCSTSKVSACFQMNKHTVQRYTLLSTYHRLAQTKSKKQRGRHFKDWHRYLL